jgi:hypothetical protein
VASATPTLANEQGAVTEPLAVVEGQSALTDGLLAPEAQVEAKVEAEVEGETPPPEAPEPIKYEDFTLPDGMAKDDPLLAKFTETASLKGVSQEAAQALINDIAPQITEAMQAPYKEWQKRQTEWLDAIQKDPEIGGEKLKPVQARIGRLLADTNFVDAGFAQAMIETGAGNHPAIVKTFAKLAARLTEGEPARTGGPATQPKSLAERMYPNLTR